MMTCFRKAEENCDDEAGRTKYQDSSCFFSFSDLIIDHKYEAFKSCLRLLPQPLLMDMLSEVLSAVDVSRSGQSE